MQQETAFGFPIFDLFTLGEVVTQTKSGNLWTLGTPAPVILWPLKRAS
jgi:hypothetical protein